MRPKASTPSRMSRASRAQCPRSGEWHATAPIPCGRPHCVGHGVLQAPLRWPRRAARLPRPQPSPSMPTGRPASATVRRRASACTAGGSCLRQVLGRDCALAAANHPVCAPLGRPRVPTPVPCNRPLQAPGLAWPLHAQSITIGGGRRLLRLGDARAWSSRCVGRRRYSRRGQPLWVSADQQLRAEAVPAAHDGQPRVFEFQVRRARTRPRTHSPRARQTAVVRRLLRLGAGADPPADALLPEGDRARCALR